MFDPLPMVIVPVAKTLARLGQRPGMGGQVADSTGVTIIAIRQAHRVRQ